MANRSRAGVRAWKLWSEPPKFLGYWVLTVAAAVVLTVVTAVTIPPTLHDVGVLGLLAGLGMAQAEAGRHIERLRRLTVAGPHINLTSPWTMAGVLLLPPALFVALIAVLYAHLGVRSWRRLWATPPHRTIGNACNTALSCFAGYRVMTWTGISGIEDAHALGPASIVNLGAAILIYFVVAAALAIPGVWSANHTIKGLVSAVIPGRRVADTPVKELVGGPAYNALEFTTLWAGALVALAMASPLWFLAGIVAGLMVWVHKGVMDKQLDLLGERDHTTGLLNQKGFYRHTADALDRANRDNGRGAIVMIEIDRIGDLNKGYRRIAGDEVLAAVADTVRDAVSDRDVVGRFSGPELFVVLLRDTTEQDAVKIAERIRIAVAYLRVPVINVHGRKETIMRMSVSIGVTAFQSTPDNDKGLAIHTLLNDADTALQQARQLGRNQVRVS